MIAVLKSEFEVTEGNGRYFVGIEINRNKKTGDITIKQEQYIKRVLEKFRMAESKAMTTPAVANERERPN